MDHGRCDLGAPFHLVPKSLRLCSFICVCFVFSSDAPVSNSPTALLCHVVLCFLKAIVWGANVYIQDTKIYSYNSSLARTLSIPQLFLIVMEQSERKDTIKWNFVTFWVIHLTPSNSLWFCCQPVATWPTAKMYHTKRLTDSGFSKLDVFPPHLCCFAAFMNRIKLNVCNIPLFSWHVQFTDMVSRTFCLVSSWTSCSSCLQWLSMHTPGLN